VKESLSTNEQTMPPAKTIFVDVPQMLRNALRIGTEQAAAANAWHDAHPMMRGEEVRHEDLQRAEWVPRNLELLAGKPLTASERIRHQQALRRMEADGLVDLAPRFVRLTDAGREAATNG
jgi:hypothetical protein